MPLLLMKYFSLFSDSNTKGEIKISSLHFVCNSSPAQLFQLVLKNPKQIKNPSENES